jgi:type II secretory pathway pseudopilin PulG
VKAGRAFTLVECIVASLVVLIVVGTLAVAVKFFVEGTRRLELRRNILMVASSEVSMYEREGYPDTGENVRQETIGSAEYTIYSTVTQLDPVTRELVVSVRGSSGKEAVTLALVRQFYQ